MQYQKDLWVLLVHLLWMQYQKDQLDLWILEPQKNQLDLWVLEHQKHRLVL
jgi:hypothetical protein